MKNPPGARIHGKIEPFTPVLDQMLKDAVTHNGMTLFREALKDAIAQRMQVTMYTPIEITNDCLYIIKNHTANPRLKSFITCSLRYYCNKKKHFSLDFNFTYPSCKSKDYHKSLQHAKQDCLECSKHYLRILKKQFESHNDSKMLQRCHEMEISIEFVCNYISAILESNLPQSITSSTYNKIFLKDSSISEIYSYSNLEDCYFLINKKTLYSVLDLSSATEIFCSKFNFKI